MGATGVAVDATKNQLANNYASTALYLSLLRALTLQATVSIGATTFSVDLTVQAGDVLVLEQGLSAQEQVTVSSVSGSGPYTVTPVNALTKAHTSGAFIAHVPVSTTTVHEVASITRTAANWTAPSPAGVITSAASGITVTSGSGKVVGSLALLSAATSFSVSALTSATDTITETSTAVANDDVIVFTAVGAAALTLNTVYFVVSKATNSFKVAATKGGSAITLGTASGLAYTKGVYLDATPVTAQSFVSATGTYTPIWVETVS